MNNKVKDGNKSLNPQAAQYYKRLILVSDRYLILVKRFNKQKVILWFMTIAAVMEGLVLLGMNEKVRLVLSLLENSGMVD